MLINKSFKIKNLQISQKTLVKTANLPQPLEISTKIHQNSLFTAANAA